MSTKTLRKRIALVAVASLGAGLLSIAPAYADNEGLNIASNGGDATTSRGIVSGNTGEDLTGKLNTLKMIASGSLFVTANGQSGTDGYNNLIVSGATITSCSGDDLNSTGTVCLEATDATDITATVVPNAGATSFTISQYNTTVTSELNRITVSVVAATTVGAFSASKSDIYVFSEDYSEWEESNNNVDRRYDDGDSPFTGATKATSASTATILNGDVGYLSFDLVDGNDNPMSSSTTGVTASATGGCVVGFTSATAIGTAATTVDNNGSLVVKKITANAPAKCVVTLAVNGAVVSTKTYNFLGQVTKLVVSDIVIAKSGADTADAFFVDAQDSAGNSIPGVTVSNNASLTGSVSAIDSADTTYADGGSLHEVTCVTKGLAKGLQVKVTNDSAATITSDLFDMQCSGSPVNYTASLDKASYTIGEVATLTITAKDSSGNLTWDGATLADNSSDADAAKTAVSIAGGPMAQVGAISSADSFSSGVKKYKFTVGGIASGSFQLVVDLPNLNSTTYSQSAQTVAYKVTLGTDGGVSNADVLKAIVSLIASINKQIAALQKALLKK